MIIEFNEKDHTYSVNGDIASISVTQLLSKHKLAPDFSGVDKTILKKKAKKGTEIHKDLENVLNVAKYEPKTEEGNEFAKWVAENVDCAVGEQKLAYEFNGMIMCGTADVFGFMKDGSLFVADHKTTAKFEREYVSWQVSVLDYMARHLDGQKINGKPFNWKGASKFFCFHYTDGKMQAHELEKVSDSEIEKLIYAEYNNETYQRPQLVIEKDLMLAVEKAETCLAEIESKKKVAEENAKVLREKILAEMKRQGIKSWETEKVKISYVAPIDRLTVDSKKLKQEYPLAYEKCQKITKVKESVRITLRSEEI